MSSSSEAKLFDKVTSLRALASLPIRSKRKRKVFTEVTRIVSVSVHYTYITHLHAMRVFYMPFDAINLLSSTIFYLTMSIDYSCSYRPIWHCLRSFAWIRNVWRAAMPATVTTKSTQFIQTSGA